MSPRPFAHLLPAEAVLWAAWLTQQGRRAEEFRYDVRVGRGRPVPAGTPENIARDWTLLTQQRIDALEVRDGAPTLYEISPRGSRSAFGAIELYRDLYRQTFDYEGPVQLVLVVGEIRPDFREVAQARGIQVFIVRPEEEAP